MTMNADSAYVRIWLLGFQGTNTLWFDGVELIDLTSQRVKRFNLDTLKAEAQKLDDSTSKAVQSEVKALNALEKKIENTRKRMQDELNQLSPLAYRRLLVEVDKAGQEYADRLWTAKTLVLLEE